MKNILIEKRFFLNDTYIILVTEHNCSDDLKDVFSGDLFCQAAGVLLELL